MANFRRITENSWICELKGYTYILMTKKACRAVSSLAINMFIHIFYHDYEKQIEQLFMVVIFLYI